uniref:Putative VP3 n=1 Tax=Grey teal gyrovirus TaxID=2798291 RepID=A0A7T4S044_9VIRU|nr:putative VP3 [Grey teal gyrovirus]
MAESKLQPPYRAVAPGVSGGPFQNLLLWQLSESLASSSPTGDFPRDANRPGYFPGNLYESQSARQTAPVCRTTSQIKESYEYNWHRFYYCLRGRTRAKPGTLNWFAWQQYKKWQETEAQWLMCQETLSSSDSE